MTRPYGIPRSRRAPNSGKVAPEAVSPAASAQEPRRLDLKRLWAVFRAQPACFLLACLYLFFEYVRPQSIYSALDILPFSELTILGGLAALVPEIGRNGRTKSPANVLLALFCGVVLLSAVLAYWPEDSIRHWNDFLPWVLVYFLIVNSVTTRDRFLIFLMLFLLWNFKMSQHGFRSWAQNGFGFSSWGISGAPGWFQNSGEVGIEMCIFLPLSVCCYFGFRRSAGRIVKWSLLLMAVTAGATILASNSRGAMFGAAGAALFLALTSRRRVSILLLVAAAILVGYWLTPEQSLERFNEMGSDSTSQSRLLYWSKGWEMMKEHPIFGVGYFNWIHYFSLHYAGELKFFKGVELPHNIFVQAGAELGFVGLAAYVAMIVVTFVLNARTRRVARARGLTEEWWIAQGMDAGMIGFLLSAQFISVVYYPYFWIGLALTVALNRAVGASAPPAANGVLRRVARQPMERSAT